MIVRCKKDMSEGRINWTNRYIIMRDGTRLAVSVGLFNGLASKASKCPAVVITTRYWRATAYSKKTMESQTYAKLADVLCINGYAMVVVDARGSGASFGHRKGECGHDEVLDIGEVIEWVGQQTWCDGRVATMGTSYSGNTTLYSLVTAPSALRVGLSRAPDFDIYRHLIAPGGIVNHWFNSAWGKATAAQDRNDVETLISDDYWFSSEQSSAGVLGVFTCR